MTRAVVAIVVLAIVILVATATLAGCSNPPPTHGRVTKREFTPAHWEDGYRAEVTSQFRCHTVSSYNYMTKTYETTEQCGMEPVTTWVYEEHHQWVNDRWRLELKDCTTKNDKEKCRTGWRTVTQHDFDRHQIGDYYPKYDEHK